MKTTTEYTKTQNRRDFKPILAELLEKGEVVVECADSAEVFSVQVYIYRLVRRYGKDCKTQKVMCKDGPGLVIELV